MNKQGSKPWFDDIGLKYLEKFEEMETAKKEKERQQEAITKHLANIIRNALREENRGIKREEPKPDYFYFYLAGDYTEYRKERKKDETWAAGVGFYWGELDDPPKPFAFVRYLLFQMKQPSFEKVFGGGRDQNLIRLLAEVEGAKSINFRKGYGEGYAWISTFWSAPDDRANFTIDVFEERLKLLPRLFQVADNWVSKEYKRIKEQEG